MAPKKETEEVIPMVDSANQEVIDFAIAEDKEADRIFWEHQGLQADGKTPLDEEAPAEETEEVKAEAKEEPKDEGKPVAEVVKDEPKSEDDLTVDLTVENADKRISSAQKKMHESNKTAKDAVDETAKLRKENEDLRKMMDDKVTEAPIKAEAGAVAEAPQQTEAEVDEDLEKLRSEYPEIAEPMIKMMQRQKAENTELKSRLDKQDERNKQSDATAKETEDNLHYNAISEVHPDFNEISQEPLLDDWINDLDPVERAGARAIRKGGETGDVIALLTKFKKANGYKVPGETPKATPKTKLEKAKKHVTPQFNKGKEINSQDKQVLFTQEQISKWTEKEWQENEKAVDAAMAQGLVR